METYMAEGLRLWVRGARIKEGVMRFGFWHWGIIIIGWVLLFREVFGFAPLFNFSPATQEWLGPVAMPFFLGFAGVFFWRNLLTVVWLWGLWSHGRGKHDRA